MYHFHGIVQAGIPTIGHLGLTPQSVAALGGFRYKAKTNKQADNRLFTTQAIEEAGAFMILLEMVPNPVCKLITERAKDCIIISLHSSPNAHANY